MTENIHWLTLITSILFSSLVVTIMGKIYIKKLVNSINKQEIIFLREVENITLEAIKKIK